MLGGKLGSCAVWPSFILHGDLTAWSGRTVTKPDSGQLILTEGEKIIIKDNLRQTW